MTSTDSCDGEKRRLRSAFDPAGNEAFGDLALEGDEENVDDGQDGDQSSCGEWSDSIERPAVKV
jgi:hypothetical protein